jgi:hypothetical protein
LRRSNLVVADPEIAAHIQRNALVGRWASQKALAMT